MVNGIIGDGIFGGVPLTVSVRPDSVAFFLNYSVEAGDSALFLILMKKQGKLLTKFTDSEIPSFYKISGNSGGLFKRMAYKIKYDSIGVPDTAIIGFATTNLFIGKSKFINNLLIVDDISFIPGNTTFINSNFESWYTAHIDRPDSWFNFRYVGLDTLNPDINHMVTKVYFNAPNDLAAQITNVSWYQNFIIGGELAIHNGLLDNKVGGFPIRGKHITLNGYYKYFPAPGDSMSLFLSMMKGKNSIGYASLSQKDTVAVFTPFTIFINYDSLNIIPDTADIGIRCGNNRNAAIGSKLIIDKLSFDGFISGIQQTKTDLLELEGMKVYPNPARDYLIVENLPVGSKECSLSIMSITGQLLKEVKLSLGEQTSQLETGSLPPGFYVLIMKKGEKVYTKKIIIQ